MNQVSDKVRSKDEHYPVIYQKYMWNSIHTLKSDRTYNLLWNNVDANVLELTKYKIYSTQHIL
jgi:hypothetical protein